MIPRISGLANLETQAGNDRVNKMRTIFKGIFLNVILSNNASADPAHDRGKYMVSKEVAYFFYYEDLKDTVMIGNV